MKNPQLAQLLYREFEKLHQLDADYGSKIMELYRLLTRLFVELSKTENIPFTTMFARIAFVCHQHQLSNAMQWRIHQLTKRKERLFTQVGPASEQAYLTSLKTAAYAVSALCQTAVPNTLKILLPETEEDVESKKIAIEERFDTLRVMVLDAIEERDILVCKPAINPDETIHVRYNVNAPNAYNEHYNSTIHSIKHHFNYKVTLNLIEVAVGKDGLYYPKGFVVEPDYMVDVSGISECFQSFGASANLFLLKKFLPFTYSVPLMLGNIANYFLDELMTNSDATFVETFPKVFSLNPLAFVTFSDSEIRSIYQKSQKHFTNLKSIVKKGLSDNNITPKDCYLEPSFFSERYGIQGRLDIWYKNPLSNKAAIIELKSGKPFAPNRFGLSHNHYTQTILYDLLVRSAFGEAVDPLTYILYSGIDIDHLKFAPNEKTQQNEAIKFRNEIIAIEKKLVDLDLQELDDVYTIIDQLTPNTMPKAMGFIARDLRAFAHTIERASKLERLYFLNFVSFTAREHQLAKTGVAGKDNANGVASLWLNPLEEKDENFEVLAYLKISDNQAHQDPPIVQFLRTKQTNPLANFRQGDIVVFYPYLKEGDNALSNQMFKGSITSIDGNFVSVQLHSRQFNHSLFEQDIYWHIERDMMESGFRVQYRALYAFLQAKEHNRSLLLTTKAPEEQPIVSVPLGNPNLSQEQTKVLHKAIAAKDYFLLVGPPGTGKTKFMLAEMVRYLLDNTNEQILLLAYTNRAVDEICEAIHKFAEKDYLRVGSKHSCDPHFYNRLFSVQTEHIKRRKDLYEVIMDHRIFVSTVASIANKTSLLKLKKFNTTIIDEASQILEPMLVGILPHFQRFVLIGDHKQLPAVVVQDKDRSAVKDKDLHSIGLHNRRNSLFERLYNRAQQNDWHWAFDRLSHQGRMHGDICAFPSHYFYNNNLKLLPEALPISKWQREALSYQLPEKHTTLQAQLAKHRMLYFDCPSNAAKNHKTNPDEATMVGQLVANFDALYQANGRVLNPADVGVITPFRAQIAQIRHVLSKYNKGYENCTIDTVERYQGGARDIIIISLCLNSAYQLDSIISLSDDEQVDRKLNVALTRARQHLIIVGNQQLMELDPRYANLIQWIQDKNKTILDDV